jgi:hypothetical protein
MSSSKNWSGDSNSVRNTLTRELWTAADRSAQFQARVSVFGDNCVRVGISRFWWNDTEKRFLPSQRGHCYFPAIVLDQLEKAIPDLQAEVRRLEVLHPPAARRDGMFSGCSHRIIISMHCVASL